MSSSQSGIALEFIGYEIQYIFVLNMLLWVTLSDIIGLCKVDLTASFTGTEKKMFFSIAEVCMTYI